MDKTKQEMPIDLLADVAAVYSIAFQQNQYPLIGRLELENKSTEQIENIKVVAEFDPADFESVGWFIDSVDAGRSVVLKNKNLKLSATLLEELVEKKRIELKFSVYINDELATVIVKEIELLPKNHWGGELHMPELLAAFVTPNSGYCDALLKKASVWLHKNGFPSQLDGYQSNSRERPYMIAQALWAVVCGEKITYSEPPAGFAESGQKIRLAPDIAKSSLATCLDTALLFAGCLEQAGLNSVIVLTKGHAMAGVWLLPENFPRLTSDDPVDLRNRVALMDLVLFETTLATNDSPVQFSQAINEADRKISEEVEHEFVYVLDLKQARSREITPINVVDAVVAAPAETIEKKEVECEQAPPLPRVTLQEMNANDLHPDKRVEQWLGKLLDLSKRNKLLNIGKRSVSIPLCAPDIHELEDYLAEGKKFNINSIEDFSSGRSSEQYTAQTGNNLEEQLINAQMRQKVLIAGISKKEIDKNLITLFRRTKTDIEEGGANTLFLALGLLRWNDGSATNKSYKAPLVLLPVKLERTSAKAPIKLMQLPDEEPIFNLTLIEMLRQDFEIDLSLFQQELPQDDKGVDVNRIWAEVRERIKGTSGFEVVEELVLSNFSFSKYLMWKDLKDRADQLKQSPFVNHLIDSPIEPYPHSAQFMEPNEVDRKVDIKQFYAPLNADSSQIVAIAASDKQQDFVLEGPPGTGKSETIANIIAHNIALGRKVLFVAEKMAALDVVYWRLEKIGLKHLCLELHSNKASKKEVIEQFREAFSEYEGCSPDVWREKADELGALRENLNQYVHELHEKSSLGYSCWDAVSKVVGAGNCQLQLDWPDGVQGSPASTKEELQKVMNVVRALGQASAGMGGLDSTAKTSLAIVNCTDWDPVWEKNLLLVAGKLNDKIGEYKQSLINFLENLGVSAPTEITLATSAYLVKVAGYCADSVNQSYRFAIDQNAQALLDNLGKLSDLKKRHQTLTAIDELLRQNSCPVASNGILELPIDDWKQARALAERKNIISQWFTKIKINGEMRRAGLRKINKLSDLDYYDELRALAQKAREEVFPEGNWRDDELSELKTAIDRLMLDYAGDGILDQWATTYEMVVERQALGREIRRVLFDLSKRMSDPDKFMEQIRVKLIAERDFLQGSALDASVNNLLNVNSELTELLTSFAAVANAPDLGSRPLDAIQSDLSSIKETHVFLRARCDWVKAKEAAMKFSLQSVVDGLDSGIVNSEEVEEQFEIALCKWLAPILIKESPVLRQFRANAHVDNIQRFRDLDENLAALTGEYIVAKLAAERPDRKSYRTISREMEKQQRHKPVRKIIGEEGSGILDIKPCFLMSPLSVAQYLPADFQGFDLVIFDEASQITVWDAIGAIARGKNVIVVGDPKQMPPTNFFNRSHNDEGDEEGEEADMESILDQAKVACVSSHRLTGHYRSRHESLIAFSNYHYYKNELITYPSAETKESAVIWHHVKDGVYSKGTARNNPKEAQAVVGEVVRRLKDDNLCRQSIGIVTFNSEQQRLIEELLDKERKADIGLEPFFSDDHKEPVFVKNLETVQGDQRDVIFLSVGYGPTEPMAARMSMAFGPLNRVGGERRLNVAITRATTEMLIFSSFDAKMIDLNRTKAVAIEHLKIYIDYAERGAIAMAQAISQKPGDQFDSYFERAVAEKLREKGWEVRTQIGVSKFRIDQGIVNPDYPGSFLAGVECDGASYHSSPSARDRDRVRHIILENLGWKLIRIWSTEYFANPDYVIDDVDKQLHELLEKSRAKR